MTIPSSTLTPGVSIDVQLVSTAGSLGASRKRALICSAMSSAGNATANAVNSSVSGPDAVATLLGPGTQGHLAAVAFFAEAGDSAALDVIGVVAPAGGTAATQTLLFDDTTPVTVAQTLTLWIAGRVFTYTWLPGVTDTTAASAVSTMINAAGSDLPVTGPVSAETVTITAKYKGVFGNDIKVRATLTGGTGGAITLGGAALAGGLEEPVYTTALTNMLGVKYWLIHFCTSNADAATAASTSTPSLVNAKILTRNSGFNALLQQSVFGHTGSTSAAKAGIAQQNLGFCQYVCARNAESLPCEWAGAEMGARIREEQLDPNVNRTYRVKMPYRATLRVSPTLTADKYTPAELEDMLQSGASAVIYLDSGVPLVSIPRTTYFKDAFSNLDHRLVGVNQTSTYYEVAYGIGAYLPDRFDGMRVVPDQPQTAAELPTGVVDESTIRANLLVYLDPAIKAGWIRKDKLKAAVDSGSFSVKVDANNPNKVNYRIPLSAVPGLWTNDITILGGS